MGARWLLPEPGPAAEIERRPWSSAERIAFTLFVVGLLSSLFAFVHAWYDARNDASMYIVTARAIANGEGYTYLGTPFRIRPPGFPAMLSLLIRVLGTSFFALNLFVSLVGAAGVVLLFLHQRTRVGWILALLTASAVWLDPGYQRMCNQVMSDVPGVTLLVLCLLLWRWASRSPSWQREIVLGASIGLSAYVRTALVLLVPAIIVSRVASRLEAGAKGEPWRSFVARRLALFVLLAWIIILPWSVRNALAAPPAPVDQTVNYSLSTGMWHTDPGDPGSPRYSATEILSRVPLNVRAIACVLGSRMQLQVPGAPPPTGTEVLDAVIALCFILCLLAVMVRRLAPTEIFAAGLLLLVMFYFSFTDRLLLPVYVIAFAATVEVFGALMRRIAGVRATALVVPVLVVLLIVLDFKPRLEWARIEERHRAYSEIASAVKSRLKADARLASAQGFHYSVYLDRPVYSLIHAIHRAGTIEAAEGVIDKYGINTIMLSPLEDQDSTIAPYFRERYGSGVRSASALVWRVRPPFEPPAPETPARASP